MRTIGSDWQSCCWPLVVFLTLILQFSGVQNGFACLSNPCIHGVCIDDLNSTYSCYCIDGYTGVQCQTNWDECWSSPCQNGGICIDGIAMFNCSCPPGFVGNLCEEDFNECDSNPCQNNGTCIDAHNGYICLCMPGYSGPHCEIDVAVCNTTNETRCAHGGICVEGPGDTFSCQCSPGWTGVTCDLEMNECLSAPCQNGAVCIDLHADYACACLFGYTGRNCEVPVAVCKKNPCRNGALCLMEDNHSACYCVPDYHGDLCQYQYDECQLGPRCMNGGTCIDGIDNFTCSCPPNLTGVLCECLILGENNYDCKYISPTPVTFTSSPSTTTEKPSSTTEKTSTTFITTTEKTYNTTTEITTTETTKSTQDDTFTTVPKDHFNISSPTTTISTTLSTIPTSPETEALPNTTIDTTLTPYITEFFTAEKFTTTPISRETYLPTTSTTTSSITTESIIDTTVLSTDISSSSIETTEVTNKIPTTTERTTEKPTTSTLQITTVEGTTEDLLTSVYPTSVPSWNTTITPSTIKWTTTMKTDLPISTEMVIITSPTETLTSVTVSNITVASTVSTTILPSITTFFTEEPETTSVKSTSIQTTTEGTTEPTVFIDCTKRGSQCRNGGSCIFENGNYNCLCPFDTEGLFCEIHLGIRKAAFNGESYLSHRLVNISDILIEFRAKTFASNGLLFYTHVDSTYMALYIEDGYLKFKFSCGYQTMLLSELNIPVNNGNEMRVRAELEFSNNFKHCDATIKVNNSLSMTGDQTAVVNKLVKPKAWLHLGGIPQIHSVESLPNGGFIGCMTDLKISGKKVDIFKDAEDGVEVAECASFACLSSPCQNGASCSSHGENWQCNCKDGYTGQMCEVSVCDNNPCLYGGTCVPFSGTGYICLCPFGKHGHFCENDIKVTEPNFSSSIRGLSSFVAYPIPDGISSTMEMSFKFIPTTMEQISILMFIGQKGQHDAQSDHMAVSFVKGYIMLTWNLGSGPRRIFTSHPIARGQKEYEVSLGYIGRRAWLYVDPIGNVTGRTPGNLVKLDVLPLLYFGGHDSLNFSTLPHDLPLHTGFSGCIYDVKIRSGSILIPLQGSREAIGRSVGQCGTTECYKQRCQNDGACLHHGSTFMCLCQDKWFGPVCTWAYNPCDSTRHKCSSGSTCVPTVMDYECDCPFGLTGRYCDKEENITDVSLSGRRSYIAVQSFEIDPIKFNIELEIRILKNDGLLFFTGRRDYSFISLFLESGLLELRVVTGKKKGQTDPPLVIRSSKLLVVGVWHKVLIGVYGRKVYISVDQVINTGLMASGSSLTISENIFLIGGLPDMSLLPSTATPSLPVHFVGCIRRFTTNSKHIPLTKSHVLHARNINDCDGTPCGGDACENGGTCWLDASMQPRCLCVQPYYGVRCEMVPDCVDDKCQHEGRCTGSSCSCKMGWKGTFCENEISVKTPEFSGSSFLVVKKLNDKKRDTRGLELRRLYLNFTTASPDGLLMWSRKDKNFIGVGVEKGYIKIAYSIGKSSKNFIEILSLENVSDGLWHSIEITFTPLTLKLDGRQMRIHNKSEKETSISPVLSSGIFYIGGVPTNSTIFNETHGIFNSGFDGCIDAFAANSENIVENFGNLEGTNIDTCDLPKI